MRSVWCFVLWILIVSTSYANDALLSLELKNTNLADAIRIMAKFMHLNVVISDNIVGNVTLSLKDAMPEQAFDLLLISHDLARWQVGDVSFVAPRLELIKHQQEELKWQEVTKASAPLRTEVWQLRYANAVEIGHIIQSGKTTFLSKRGHMQVDARTNTLCIQDISTAIDNLHQLIKRLDVPIQQIVIEARLASVDSDVERELGVDFSVAAKSNVAINQGHYSLAVASLADGSLLDMKLAALENSGRAELISSPSLFTANQQPAAIEAGEEVPYQEVSESGGTAVTFKKAVLALKVTPQVLPGNRVLLQLQINQDRPSNRMVQGVPTISTRQIKTNAVIKNGQTIVLGGIYETNQEEGQKRLPFISEIPLIGALFTQQNRKENKRELLIFVTPKITQTL